MSSQPVKLIDFEVNVSDAKYTEENVRNLLRLIYPEWEEIRY